MQMAHAPNFLHTDPMSQNLNSKKLHEITDDPTACLSHPFAKVSNSGSQQKYVFLSFEQASWSDFL